MSQRGAYDYQSNGFSCAARGGLLIQPFVLLAAILWVGWFGFAAAWLARRRDRVVPLWATYGAILGPVALALLWVAPHGHCQTCHMPTVGWLTTCPWCRENVNTVPPTSIRAPRMPRQPGPALVARPDVPAHPDSDAGPETPPPMREVPRPFVLRSTPSPRVQPAVATPPPANETSRPSTAPDEVPEPPQRAPATALQPPFAVPELPQATRPTNGADRADSFVIAWPSRPRPPAPAEAGPATRVLATATYVTGTARLEPGRRYAIALQEQRLQVLGPIDIDDKKVALERPVADIKVSAVEGRLVINEETRSGVVLAFMSVAGAGLDDLARTIRASAQDAAS